ncbi:MAG: xanthine dehydrogenase family protein subunit M [Candidatus Aminicenantes bacterium]|nr:MAG: xanthine dehydrogenase family protein subunit M [Candidatus Aminicenantes bacterium]
MIHDFNYMRASTVEETLGLIDRHKDNYKIICGGQSLLILMRQGLVAPEYLIDIKNVQELNYINFDRKDGLKIGATTTHRQIEKSTLIKKHYNVLVGMEEGLASVQTRNWGTIGGNLAHADPAGDPGPVFIAMSATVKMANKEKERTLPLEEFFIDYFETALEDDELLLEVQIPPISPKTSIAYEKFNIVKNDQGLVSVAVSVTLSDDGLSCKDTRIVLGAAAPIPMRAKEAEQALIGKKLNDRVLDKVGEKASVEADPVDDIHATEMYRRHLVKSLTKRMVKKAWEQAKALS